jgi:hypothetical protein
MKIVCCTYRDWAKKIYVNIKKEYVNHKFLMVNSKEELIIEKIFNSLVWLELDN